MMMFLNFSVFICLGFLMSELFVVFNFCNFLVPVLLISEIFYFRVFFCISPIFCNFLGFLKILCFLLIFYYYES